MLVSLNNINKFYNGEHILKDVNLIIEDNDRIGLIGINGCGKTTLLRIITGREIPDRKTEEDGIVSVASKAAIGLLEQNSGLDGENTVISEMSGVFSELSEISKRMRELEHKMGELSSSPELKAVSEEYSHLTNIFETKGGYITEVKIKTVLFGMGFSLEHFDRKISGFSGGEKTRLAIAKLLLEEPNLLILDEPTNHLDFKTVSWLEDYLQTYKGALLIVSHDRYFLDRVATSICELERGELNRYKGNYSVFTNLKAEANARRQKEFDSQQKQIAKLEDYVARNITRASTSKSAKSRRTALEKIEVIERPFAPPKGINLCFESKIQPPFDVLSVKDADISVGNGEKFRTLVPSVSFEVKRGDRLAVIGDNGTGKSTLLKILMRMHSSHGKIRWADNIKLSYFDQEGKNLNPENTVMEEVHGRFPFLNDFDVRSVLGKVRLTGENVSKKVRLLSGGERAKLCFAIMMLEHGNVLILDEPTNHLDLSSKEFLEEALCAYDGTIIFVSHDRYLLKRLADGFIVLDSDSTEKYSCGFEEYMQIKKQAEQEEMLRKEKERQEKARLICEEKNVKAYKTKEQRSLDAKKRNRIKELEREIDEFQSKEKMLEAEIASEAIYSDFKLLEEKCAELENVKATFNKCYEEWAELSDE